MDKLKTTVAAGAVLLSATGAFADTSTLNDGDVISRSAAKEIGFTNYLCLSDGAQGRMLLGHMVLATKGSPDKAVMLMKVKKGSHPDFEQDVNGSTMIVAGMCPKP